MWAAVMIRLMDTSVKRTWASSAQQASISRFRFSSGNRKNVAVGTVSPLYDRLSQCDRLSCIIQKPLYPVKAGIVKLLLRCHRPKIFSSNCWTVYQKSTKKALNPLRRRGLGAFHILGHLPNVYQFHFFTSKATFFRISSCFPQLPHPTQGA